MFSINTKRHKGWQQLTFSRCLPYADHGSKCITYITLFTLQHQWGSSCYCGCTKPGLLIPPAGKRISCHHVVMKENTQQILPGQTRRMGSSCSKDPTPQWLSGEIFFSNSGKGEGLSLPDPLLDILIGWKWGHWVVFWESASSTFWSQSVWSLPGVVSS